jgi:hypothetical protein
MTDVLGAFGYFFDFPCDAVFDLDGVFSYRRLFVFWPYFSGVFHYLKGDVTTGLTYVFCGTVAWDRLYFNVYVFR